MTTANSKNLILHVDDDVSFLELFKANFEDYFEIYSLCNPPEVIDFIKTQTVDAVITDYEMPDINGLELLKRIKREFPDMPVIFKTGQGNEDIARDAFVSGAGDYFTKDMFDFAHNERFVNSVKNAIAKRKAEQERTLWEKSLRVSENRYRELFENINSGVAVYEVIDDGEDFIFKDFNRAGEKIDNQPREELIGKSIFQVRPDSERFGLIDVFRKVWKTGIPAHHPITLYQDDHLERWYENYVYKLPTGEIVAVFENVTDRKRVDEKILHLASFPQFNPQPVAEFDIKGNPTYINPALKDLLEDREQDAVQILIPEDILKEMQEKGTAGRHHYEREFVLGQRIFRETIQFIPEFHTIRIYTNDITSQKQAEESLKQREKQFRRIIENLQDAYLQLDMEGNILMASPSAAKLYGYGSPDEMIGLHVTVLYKNPREREKVYHQFLKQGYLHDWIGEGKRKDGSTFWFSLNAQVFYDDYGQIMGTEGFVRDITSRKNIEKRLETSEARLRWSLESARAGAWEWDLHTNENVWSDELWALYDLEPYSCQPSYQTWLDSISTLDRDMVEWLVKEAVSRDTELNIEWRVNTRDGSERWLMSRGQPIKNHEGKTVLYRGVVIDITHKKKTEEDLRENKFLLSAIVNGSPIPQFVIDKNHRVIQWNKALAEYTHLKPEEIIGTDLHWKAFYNHKRPLLVDLLVDQEQEKIPLFYGDKCRPSKHLIGAVEGVDFFPTVGEQGKWLYFTASTIRDEKGNILGAIETLEDITEKVEAEKKLEKTNKELNDFAYRVSHDLKNPINIIRGYGEILKKKLGQENNYVNKINESADHLLKFIDNELKLAKSGLTISSKTEIDIENLIRIIVSTWRGDKENLDLIIHSPLHTVYGDRSSLIQVFTNLIENSLRYRNPSVEKLTINIRTVKSENDVIISIQDNGMGIEKQNMEKIFKPGFTVGSKQGTGFGLAIVKKIVEAHDGSIRAESDGKNMGTTFYIRLPAKGN